MNFNELYERKSSACAVEAERVRLHGTNAIQTREPTALGSRYAGTFLKRWV